MISVARLEVAEESLIVTLIREMIRFCARSENKAKLKFPLKMWSIK